MITSNYDFIIIIIIALKLQRKTLSLFNFGNTKKEATIMLAQDVSIKSDEPLILLFLQGLLPYVKLV